MNAALAAYQRKRCILLRSYRVPEPSDLVAGGGVRDGGLGENKAKLGGIGRPT